MEKNFKIQKGGISPAFSKYCCSVLEQAQN